MFELLRTTKISVAVAAGLVCGAAPVWGDEGESRLPPEIQRILDARKAYTTANYSWTLERTSRDASVVREHYVSEVIADTVRQTNTGDDNGRHPLIARSLEAHLAEQGMTPEAHHAWITSQPHFDLLFEGNLWEKQGQSTKAVVYGPGGTGPVARV
ncbi:MAG: hypothetical protein ACE5E6_05870 [Phycisphaerae bacterium]